MFQPNDSRFVIAVGQHTDRAQLWPTPTLTTNTLDLEVLEAAMLSLVLNHSNPKDLSEDLAPQLPTRAHKDSTLDQMESPEAPACLEVKLTIFQEEET
jgi:hypothetical protein